MVIKNKLTGTDFNAYSKTDGEDTIGAGPSNGRGNRTSLVKAGKKLEVDLPKLPKNKLKFFFIFDDLPEDDFRGIKIIPGTRYGPAHHFEFYKKSIDGKQKSIVLLHYKFKDEDQKTIKEFLTHIDPQVHHPENGDGFG